MSLFIGIDSGTQSVKAVVYDADAKKVISEGKAPHSLIEGLPSGHMEQNPQDWVDAMDDAIIKALSSVDKSAVRGIGISGQQHGFVPLDSEGKVIRAAKLWCDTSTLEECSIIADALGGQDAAIEKVGNRILPGFTAAKILWLKRNEPEAFAKLRHVLLPHDYLNFHLTGDYFMEYGDASGTAMMDVKTREWSKEVIDAIDPAIADYLPKLSPSHEASGVVKADMLAKYGLSGEVIVSAGGGDNMMGAIGTGNVRNGVATASFGTSGTIYAYNDKPVIDSKGEIAAFCDSTGGYLPLLCTMNVTTVSEQFRNLFSMDHADLNSALNSVPVGSDGLIMLPYLEGERTPSLPSASGVFLGLNKKTISPNHMVRAAVEGVTMGMNFGLRRLRELGVSTTEVRLTGGGSRSAAWRKIIADVFGVSVVCMAEDEGAAIGGALQAVWCLGRRSNSDLKIADVVEGATELDESTRLEPDMENHKRYSELQAFYDKMSETMAPVFEEHSRFKS